MAIENISPKKVRLPIILFVSILGITKGLIADNFLQYAQGAGEWLMSEAIAVGDGYKWPAETGGDNYYTDLYDGSPGVITLFARLYEATGNEQYRQYAVGGAQWLMDMAVPEAGGYKWPDQEGSYNYGTGLYTGAAGTGNAFVNLYKVFDDTLCYDYAVGAANWLLSVAVFESADRCKWPSYQYSASYVTEIIYGAAGVGDFLLRMYDLTNNQEYLNYAKYAGNWLASQAIAIDSGYKWTVSNDYLHIYPGFSHGAAGIGYFFAELFDKTGDSLYLDYAMGAAHWLMDIAVLEGGGCKWWRREDQMSTFMTGWCHGPAGTCQLFTKLYQITSEDVYLTYATMGAAWLMDLVVPSGGGYKWPHTQGYSAYDVTVCHGAAGIGDFFLKMFDLTNDRLYLDYAEGAALWLKSVADSSAGGYRWNSFGHYYTGFSCGTAGVGLFLLDMSQTTSVFENITRCQENCYSLETYPNPFIGVTTIRFQIRGEADSRYKSAASLRIYDIAGKLVKDFSFLTSNFLLPTSVKWDGKDANGRDLPAGVYFVRLKADEFELTQKTLLLR